MHQGRWVHQPPSNIHSMSREVRAPPLDQYLHAPGEMSSLAPLLHIHVCQSREMNTQPPIPIYTHISRDMIYPYIYIYIYIYIYQGGWPPNPWSVSHKPGEMSSITSSPPIFTYINQGRCKHQPLMIPTHINEGRCAQQPLIVIT